jgi:hypothetical protein
MNSTDNMRHQSQRLQQKPAPSFNLLKSLTIIAAVLLIALVAGTGGYFLGTRNNQSVPSSQSTQSDDVIAQPSPIAMQISPSPFIPASSGSLISTANGKTYTNQKYRVSFKYPNDWYIRNSDSMLNEGLRVDILASGEFDSDFERPNIALIITYDEIDVLNQRILKEYDITKSELTTYSVLDGRMYTGTGKNNSFNGKYIYDQFRSDFIARYDNKMYWFRLWTNSSNKGSHSLIFKQVLSTFKFVE